jgi:hypothetical protein
MPDPSAHEPSDQLAPPGSQPGVEADEQDRHDPLSDPKDARSTYVDIAAAAG